MITSACVLLSSVRGVGSVGLVYPLYHDNKCLCLVVQCQGGGVRGARLPLVPRRVAVDLSYVTGLVTAFPLNLEDPDVEMAQVSKFESATTFPAQVSLNLCVIQLYTVVANS